MLYAISMCHLHFFKCLQSEKFRGARSGDIAGHSKGHLHPRDTTLVYSTSCVNRSVYGRDKSGEGCKK